jgi:hypothetical protein
MGEVVGKELKPQTESSLQEMIDAGLSKFTPK